MKKLARHLLALQQGDKLKQAAAAGDKLAAALKQMAHHYDADAGDQQLAAKAKDLLQRVGDEKGKNERNTMELLYQNDGKGKKKSLSVTPILLEKGPVSVSARP